MLRFDKRTYLSLPFKFILSVRLSNSLWKSDVPFFLEFMNTVSILFHNFIEFIILLYSFLVIYFSWYKEYMIWRISCRKFSGVLPAFSCASAIGNYWSICLGVNILSPTPWIDLYLASDSILFPIHCKAFLYFLLHLCDFLIYNLDYLLIFHLALIEIRLEFFLLSINLFDYSLFHYL